MPDFTFSTNEGMPFSNMGIRDKSRKLIINFFSPGCEHCQYMAKQYVKNADKFKDINLLMVTISDSSEVVKFKNDYHLDSLPNLVLLKDSKFRFEKLFGTAMVPSFFIYKNKKLMKEIIGETKIENLLTEDAVTGNR